MRGSGEAIVLKLCQYLGVLCRIVFATFTRNIPFDNLAQDQLLLLFVLFETRRTALIVGSIVPQLILRQNIPLSVWPVKGFVSAQHYKCR